MADIKAKKVLFKNRDGEHLIPYVGDTAIDHRITNCLLEVPQNIKLELNNGTLTLKKGSKVIVPNGAGVFDEIVIENDMTYDTSETNLATGVFFVHYNGNTHLGYALTSTSSSGTTAPAKTGLFYDTTNNVVKWNNNGSLVGRNRSLPLAIVTVTSGTGVTAIDQVFNGMGYIGSTVWVDKGVKGLIPNGRNEDGTLNNIEFTTDKILMQTQPTATANIDLYLSKTGVFRSTTIYYNEKLNFNISSTNGTNAGTVLIGNCTLTSGAISNFQPKQPFQAVDYNDFNKTPHIIDTYINGESWYRVYSDGWCEQGGRGWDPIFLKTFKDINYTIMAIGYVHVYAVAIKTKSTNGCTFYQWQTGNSAGNTTPVTWYACGYIS